MSNAITPAAFVAKWKRAKLSERAASQEHFLDLCRLLGQPTPAEHDATGAEYTFEKGIVVSIPGGLNLRGEYGFADVWWNNKFGWEYKRKGKYKDLSEAYSQLQRYREALNNPPLLIVSDITHIEIHTNFTNAANQTHIITLDQIEAGPGLELLRHVFTDPEFFRPTQTTEQVTLTVAKEIGQIAIRLQEAKNDPHAVAHFLMKCMFCLFAEDVPGLLPGKLFKKLLSENYRDPPRFTALAHELFSKMATGGNFGLDQIPYFNGGLFDDAPSIKLGIDDLGVLNLAADQDWAHIEPSILGTLFERSLDPNKRAQIGAHYTSKEDILLVINPVIMDPLRKEWSKLKQSIEAQLQVLPTPSSAVPGNANFPIGRDTPRKSKSETPKSKIPPTAQPLTSIHQQISQFLAQLSSLKILDPACGSGNFLYVAIQQLLSLEKEVITFAAQPPISLRLLPRIRPTQLLGIEINPYAAELAQVSIWIGFLQWLHLNGFPVATDTPILSKLQTIQNSDAILDVLPDTKLATPKMWPDVHFIIGNPPFLGGNMIRQGLGDEYVEALFKAYDIPKFSDLCCYWFELARRKLESAKSSEKSLSLFPTISLPRAGLLATQAIRGGVNRTVLDRIKSAGDIFMAWSDREWTLEGAAVNVSIVGFDAGAEKLRVLDGREVPSIFPMLSSDLDFTAVRALPENMEIQCQGDKKGASFDIEFNVARKILALPNPNGLSPLNVCRPWINGKEVLSRASGMWIIDFGYEMTKEEASQYEGAFEYVEKHVRPEYESKRERWWIHERPRPQLRQAIAHLKRFLFTTGLSKHRIFVWLESPLLPDHGGFAFARQDDYFFGALQSSMHVLWALRMGTQLEDRPRYTPSTTFETFPLPWPPGKENTKHPAYKRISAAAKELNDLRERWLNPPELLAPLAQILDATDKFLDVPEEARSLIRNSVLMAQAAQSPNLKKRTLTNLYNERTTWLKLAHEKLDRAVLAAYAAIDPEGHWSEDWATLYTETGAGTPLPPDHPQSAARLATDQKILANLLRLNHLRANSNPS